MWTTEHNLHRRLSTSTLLFIVLLLGVILTVDGAASLNRNELEDFESPLEQYNGVPLNDFLFGEGVNQPYPVPSYPDPKKRSNLKRGRISQLLEQLQRISGNRFSNRVRPMRFGPVGK